jgi:DNA-directed RNA polymerase specialized sigma subunit
MTPLDDFLEALGQIKEAAVDDLRKRQQREMQMWEQWKQGGQKPQDLRPLIKSFKPLVNHQANIWAGKVRDVPPAAIRAEFTNQFVSALETYDPDRGAGLGTHIRHQLKKAQRFVTTYQNPGRIPENRIYRIRELQDAEQHLDEKFGRPPTQLEVADHLKWSPKQVDVLQREVRKARPTGQFETDPSTFTPSRQKEVLRLLPYELTSDEKQVFEYLYGVGGKPQLGPGQIAQKLNMSAPKVSRLKRSIAEKYERYSK